MTQLTENVYAVEVPSMAFGLMVNNYGNESELMYMLSMEDITDDDNTEETLITKKLPPGTWQLLCTTKEATPEQIQDIIDWRFESAVRIRFRNYLGGESDYSCQYSSESLNSLLTSKGLDANKNYVLLKKK